MTGVPNQTMTCASARWAKAHHFRYEGLSVVCLNYTKENCMQILKDRQCLA